MTKLKFGEDRVAVTELDIDLSVFMLESELICMLSPAFFYQLSSSFKESKLHMGLLLRHMIHLGNSPARTTGNRDTGEISPFSH